jgi:5-methylcytosine-specific restriction endonuclease McrA
LHKTPLAKGGAESTENLAISHAECNKSKHNKTLEEHWQYRFNRRLDAEKLSVHIINVRIMEARYKE